MVMLLGTSILGNKVGEYGYSEKCVHFRWFKGLPAGNRNLRLVATALFATILTPSHL